jgi:hypothetical protein
VLLSSPFWFKIKLLMRRCLALTLLALFGMTASAQPIALTHFELRPTEEGLLLNFSTKFELSSAIEDALQKGVPLVFTAKAQVRKARWYWRDKRINQTARSWRLSYQPLTNKYRVSFSGITQNYDSLFEALNTLNRSVNWALTDFHSTQESGLYVQFSYELDTTQLPGPMQIGIGGQSDWLIRVERTQALP